MHNTMTTTIRARRARTPGRARAALFAAVLALAVGTFAHPAIVSADKDGFDACMANPPGSQNVDWTAYCCSVSGGSYDLGQCHFEPTKVQGGSTAPANPHPMPPGNPISPPHEANLG